MVSSVGFQLSKNKLITGFGKKRPTRGRGVIRSVSGMAVRTLGNMLVNRIANAISGSGSYKMTGGKRKPRKTLTGGKRKTKRTLKK